MPHEAPTTPRKPALLARLAELRREEADVLDALAREEERAARLPSPDAWISQRTSPLGKRAHLKLWRQLRDEGADGVRSAGKMRLIARATFDDALARADEKPRPAPVESGVDLPVDLAAAFGVE